jgi:hypothetical protein
MTTNAQVIKQLLHGQHHGHGLFPFHDLGLKITKKLLHHSLKFLKNNQTAAQELPAFYYNVH